MGDYIISCCSAADLTKEQFENRNIHYLGFSYMLDGVSYHDDLGQTIPFDEFYGKMADGADTKTSQIGIEEYAEYFRPFLDDGKDILHLTLSSGITGTYNSACIAKSMLKEEFPERKIYIIDSLAAASGYGLLMNKIADMRDSGLDIDELNTWVLDNQLNVHHWFFTTTLTYFIRGGRISKTAGTIGNMLNICPLLNVDNEGRLVVREKIRTKKKVIKAIVGKMEQYANGGLDYDDECYVSHAGCYEDAKTVADLVESRFHNLKGKVRIYDIGTTIGSHTGPGTVTLFFWGSRRED